MKKRLLFVLKIVVTVGLIFWLIERVDWTSVLVKLREVSVPLLLLYVIFQLSGNLISAKKWQVIARFKGLTLSLKESFFTYMTGTFINNFLPSTIGGDTYRALWLAEKSGAKAASVSTVIFDRFIGLWTIALLALLSSPVLLPFASESPSLVITYIALVVFFAVDILITYIYCKEWFHLFVERLPFFKVRRFLQEIIFYTKKHIWLRTSLWSTLFIFVGLVLSNFTLFHALGSDVNILPFASAMFLVAIVASVPLSINNIGIKEWAYITFFGLIGVSIETAVTVALLSRFIQMILSFIALPHYLANREK
ncbi:MAG: lysylphosphatidylglycerol synthase transmembrane domain-containing protein [Candidatus Moranbacteria bacterium]|nr:lysylphosphatidylglycerol synthase transmembrane domain-containing protein [Candidatus Moranbacteria bacterium]MDD3964960.1 lysylphosphatidylglycerol synthase transmembrane domain-containing protein [Candidatus Moranbacteria bacterium]